MNCAGGLALAGILGIGVAAAAAQTAKQPVDYADPNIGGIGQLLTATIPWVQYPYGVARVAPVVTPGITDRYLADKIYGFPAGPALLMASDGPETTKSASYASDFDHDFETSTPYYDEADLQTWKIKAEATVTPEAAYYRFTYPASQHGHWSGFPGTRGGDVDRRCGDPNLVQPPLLPDGFPAAAEAGAMNGTNLVAAKPHAGSSLWRGPGDVQTPIESEFRSRIFRSPLSTVWRSKGSIRAESSGSGKPGSNLTPDFYWQIGQCLEIRQS